MRANTAVLARTFQGGLMGLGLLIFASVLTVALFANEYRLRDAEGDVVGFSIGWMIITVFWILGGIFA